MDSPDPVRLQQHAGELHRAASCLTDKLDDLLTDLANSHDKLPPALRNASLSMNEAMVDLCAVLALINGEAPEA